MMHQHLQLAAWAELALCWCLWFLASARRSGPRSHAAKALSAPAGILGLLLNLLGLAVLAVHMRPADYISPSITIVPAMLLAPLSVTLAWSARRHLGPYWRVGSVLMEDHKLIKTGPYANLRHPIYSSLIGMAISTAFAYTWWPFGVVGVILTLLGIEFRVKAEERLMERFFQDEFIEYAARTRAFLPF